MYILYVINTWYKDNTRLQVFKAGSVFSALIGFENQVLLRAQCGLLPGPYLLASNTVLYFCYCINSYQPIDAYMRQNYCSTVALWFAVSILTPILQVQVLVACLDDLVKWTRVWKLRSPAFIWCTGCPKCTFMEELLTWSLDLICFVVPGTFCHPPAGIMAAEGAFWVKHN